jgi:hypothetical protein
MTLRSFKSINELRYKAKQFEGTGMVTVYDFESCAVKSDSILSEEYKLRLKKAIKILEDVPPHANDWHPGSGGKVLDLVHPSLFPLVFGKSHVLQHRKLGIDDCLDSIGAGERIQVPESPSPPESEEWRSRFDGATSSKYSTDFQWLPCEVQRRSEDGPVKITSYINNLHPRHTELYGLIEELIEKSIPLWSRVLDRSHSYRLHQERVHVSELGYDQNENWEGEFADEQGWTKEEVEDWFNADRDEFLRAREDSRTLIRPEPSDFEPPSERDDVPSENLNSLPFGSYPYLQVIVKIANIHLTPKKSEYPGGSWHVEGLMNEHIVATALYYYSTENITSSRLSFRHKFDSEMLEELPPPNDYHGVVDLFGVDAEGPRVQDMGSVLTREGRLLAFPNVLMHRVNPFELRDKSKPGHRKIVALFLVDPNAPILSTANVPPQRKDWWEELMVEKQTLGRLPQELQDQVMREVDGFPIDMKAAKKIRKALMKERKQVDELVEEGLPRDINFCEH